MEAVAVQTGQPERSIAWVVALVAAVLGIYWQTAWSMVELWRSSSTYSHGFLILPVFLWLVWNQRLALSRLPTDPSWLGLLFLVGLGLIWLGGNITSTNAPTQFAVVAMVPAAVATVLGASWARALAFPLAFLFFAVPFGDSLVPYLMDWTADFTVAALKLSGVPVHREGTSFSIPSGDWSVVEACSGIRYVFACLTVATLYAWTAYRTTARRLLFVVCAFGIAVVANWIRAYGIVMLAHLSDNRLATGIDHFIYGGVFFGVIMVIVFSLGALWREDPTAAQEAAQPLRPALRSEDAAHTGSVGSTPARNLAAALAVAATLMVWPLVSLSTGEAPGHASGQVADIEPRAGWARVDEPAAKWQPHLSNPSQVRLQTFMKNGRRVSVHLAIFDRPTPDSKLTASVNQLVNSEDRHWQLIRRGSAEVHRRGEAIPVSTGTLVGQDARIIAWHWYWIDGTLTSSPTRAALLQMLARLRGRGEASAWVTAFTADDEGTSSAPLVLEAFLTDMLASIDRALRATAGGDNG